MNASSYTLLNKDAASSRTDDSIADALAWLEQEQQSDGFWVGMLESNACMEAEWLLALHFLGIRDHRMEAGLVRSILNEQRDDGSWEVYHDAPSGNINTTVECYAALRSVGMTPDNPQLVAARRWIMTNGRFKGIRVFTRYWLALIGEWPWEETPNIPPEVMYLPRWFPFNIYNFASWARATLTPLSVLSASRASRPLPADRRLDELFPEGRANHDYSLPKKRGGVTWENFFYGADRALHIYQKIGMTPGRATATRRAIDWIVRRQEADGAWCGIQPPWIYSLMALNVAGFDVSHPVIRRGLDALEYHWSFERDGGTYIQASESPVWDTLLSVMAKQDCGVDYRQSRSMQLAVNWLLDQQVDEHGDWAVKSPNVEPGGWAFERANVFYPDVDDTAVALTVLGRLRGVYEQPARLEAALARARGWVLEMQSRNGGWAAFDKDNDNSLLTKIPFCDFGEALDPPSADVTAHVVEGLSVLGEPRGAPALKRALDYLFKEQEADGTWFGRWGVNHIYGTAAALPALEAAGEDMSSTRIRRAAAWVENCQNEDGGWGETPASYMDPALRGRGESTPSQTAWGLMSLISTGNPAHRNAIQRGVAHLVERQKEGTWDEPHYTGTGFPGYGVGQKVDLHSQRLEDDLQQSVELARGFMINYNLYRHYFPTMALGRARKLLSR